MEPNIFEANLDSQSLKYIYFTMYKVWNDWSPLFCKFSYFGPGVPSGKSSCPPWLSTYFTHTVRKSRKITGQNRSPIFWYVVLIMQWNIMEKELKSCMGVLLRADITGHGHSSPFCQNGWDGRALLGQPSKGHPCRILILFPYCSTI